MKYKVLIKEEITQELLYIVEADDGASAEQMVLSGFVQPIESNPISSIQFTVGVEEDE